MAAQCQPRALIRRMRVLFIGTMLAFFFLSGCEPTEEKAEGAWMLSGTWLVEGGGRLSDCPNPFYNSDTVTLNSRALQIETRDRQLVRVDEVSGFRFEGELLSGSEQRGPGTLRFSSREELDEGTLELSFEGSWEEPLLIEGNVEGSVRGCHFTGDFCVIITPNVAPPPSPEAVDAGRPDDASVKPPPMDMSLPDKPPGETQPKPE